MMKKLMIPLLYLLSFQAMANDTPKVIKTESKIESVTIFARGAQITRTADIKLEKGVYELQFSNLSPNLSENTIQFKADPSIEIISVKLNQGVYVVDPEHGKALNALAEKLKAIDRSLVNANTEQSVISAQINFLTANSNIGGKNSELSLTNLKQTADYYFASMRDLHLKNDAILEKKSELNKQMDDIQAELVKLENNYDRQMSQIIVTIDKKQSASSNVALSYYSPMASWQPIYDIRANDTNSPIELVYKAQISQQTYEDWQNVQITLSNSNPNISGVVPTLSPWYRNAQKIEPQPKASKALSIGYAEDEEVVFNGKRNLGYAATSAPQPRITANENGTSFEFQIRTPYTIPSSQKLTTVDINRTQVPATFNYMAVPTIKSDVFLMAHLTDWEKLNLLSGVANIYFSNTFVGNTRINLKELSDTLNISLGVDPQIIVERRSNEQYNAKRSVGSKQEQSYGWTISARNTKQNSINLTLIDQVPLSTSSDLEILIDNISNAKYNSQTGELRWELDIPSNSKQEVDFKYRLRYPKNFLIY